MINRDFHRPRNHIRRAGISTDSWITRRNLFPRAFNDRPAAETSGWTEEQKWALKNLDAARRQLMDIQVATRENGEWDLTRNGAYRFSSSGRKDLAYALLCAYVRALLWLKSGELEFTGSTEDAAGIYMM